MEADAHACKVTCVKDEQTKGKCAIVLTLMGIVLCFMLGRFRRVIATALGSIFQKYPGL